MGSTIERGNFHIKIGENQRLPLEIVGRNGREESKIQLHRSANVHGENTLGRSILVGRLIDRSGSWQPHPCVGIAVYTNDTSPTNDLTSGQLVSLWAQEWCKFGGGGGGTHSQNLGHSPAK